MITVVFVKTVGEEAYVAGEMPKELDCSHLEFIFRGRLYWEMRSHSYLPQFFIIKLLDPGAKKAFQIASISIALFESSEERFPNFRKRIMASTSFLPRLFNILKQTS